MKLINTSFGRWFFRIHGERSSVGEHKIIGVSPNSITWEENGFKKVELRGKNKFSRRIYYGLYPIWWLFHQWDTFIANPLIPRWNLGFDTMTFYPDADAETSSVDGTVWRNNAGGETFATLRAGAGTASEDNIGAGEPCAGYGHLAASNSWYRMYRGIFVFDTSGLNDGATISSATFSIYGRSKVDNIGITPKIGLTQGYSASSTALAASDYNVGNWSNTRICDTDITYAGYSTAGYNDFALNATGLGIISKTGVTKIGTRMDG
ncbi:MAG: hypothetical protein AAB875_02760, partial [Patescibacteria group bacterium]